MRSLLPFFCSCMLVFYSCSQPVAREADLSLLLSPETWSESPVSPLLYSHFIEIGFGYQIAPMQAERFFNRSFEAFPPYNGKSKNSFGFLLPGGDYIKDWSGEAWYHSGYEHNSWYAASGKPGNPSVITDESSFFITESTESDVILQPVEGGCGHGQQSIRIINNEEEKWGGMAQDGKWMENGKTIRQTPMSVRTGSEPVTTVLSWKEKDSSAMPESRCFLTWWTLNRSAYIRDSGRLPFHR